MPAVTVENTLSLPPSSRSSRGPVRPSEVDHHRPEWLRGRGLPGAPGVRRRVARRSRPVRAPRPDGRGRLRPGRAQGHAVAPAPRLRDRHLHHRRRVRAPRLARRRWPDHRRRHAVDDRRIGPAAHRGAAGGARRQRWPVPRPAAVGQPAGPGQDGRAPLPGPAVVGGRAAPAPPTAALSCGSSPGPSTACRAPAPRTRRSRSSTPRCSRAPSSTCRGTRATTPSSTCWPVGARWATRPPRCDEGQLAAAGRRRHDPRRRRPAAGRPLGHARAVRPRRPADPRAGRAVRPVRDEHQAEIIQAFEDFQAGRLGTIPAELIG